MRQVQPTMILSKVVWLPTSSPATLALLFGWRSAAKMKPNNVSVSALNEIIAPGNGIMRPMAVLVQSADS